MVSLLDSRSSGPSSSPGQDHCTVFLGKELSSHGAFLPLGVPVLMNGTDIPWSYFIIETQVEVWEN